MRRTREVTARTMSICETCNVDPGSPLAVEIFKMVADRYGVEEQQRAAIRASTLPAGGDHVAALVAAAVGSMDGAGFTTADVMAAIGLDPSKANEMATGSAIRSLGLIKRRVMIDGARINRWYRAL